MDGSTDHDAEHLSPPRTVRQRPARVLDTVYTPALGAYIVFTLDPVATLQALNDPLAIEQARALRCRKYVGCLVRDYDLPSPSRRYNKCSCILLSQGLPQASASDGVEETMCIPIVPAKHPTGRRGVRVSPPLPWDNLYHHTLLGLQLRLTPQSGDYSASPLLHADDIFYMNMQFHRDITRSAELQRVYRADHPSLVSLQSSLESFYAVPPSQVSPLRTESSEGSHLFEPTGQTSAFISRMQNVDGSATSDGSVSFNEIGGGLPSNDADDDQSSVDPVEMMLLQNTMGYEAPEDRFIPVAHFSRDLSLVTEFCDARQMHEEIAAIERIQRESEQRTRKRAVQAERERLENWALDVMRFNVSVQPRWEIIQVLVYT
ncbi:hypothetical protein BV25DRAFT_1172460 [Artomyces pyxidatus]|uniref:Uncharacterized protein n=1 Tax=Artomyces pyxidatus TaxID=48021 RepID=A0ACB8SSL8_9AGAM|nr:hypothetical protein BV25DRAFT_1172460 [Artomyces pyxidatus]